MCDWSDALGPRINLHKHEHDVTSRLDKQDHQIEFLGRKIEEGFRDLDRSIHEVEAKFHATLSQCVTVARTYGNLPMISLK